MKTDRYTKVVLTLIALGLFLNIAIHLPVQPAFATSDSVGTERNPLVVQHTFNFVNSGKVSPFLIKQSESSWFSQ